MTEVQTPAEPQKKWAGFKYEPVSGLINRHISRYLRTQRKTMRRFFAERGFPDYFLRLEAIRKNPRLGMIAKNQQFKRVLDDYAAQVIAARTPVAAPEAAATVGSGPGDTDRELGVQLPVGQGDTVGGAGQHDGGGVQPVVPEGDPSAGPVKE